MIFKQLREKRGISEKDISGILGQPIKVIQAIEKADHSHAKVTIDHMLYVAQQYALLLGVKSHTFDRYQTSLQAKEVLSEDWRIVKVQEKKAAWMIMHFPFLLSIVGSAGVLMHCAYSDPVYQAHWFDLLPEDQLIFSREKGSEGMD